MANPSPLPPGLTLSIPGQGDYLAGMSKAQSAYEQAVAKLTAQRRQQQYLAGLNQDWSVDPNAQYGGYQQMLQNEGSALDAARNQAQERGLFGGGLANQGESSLRYGQAVEQLGFRNQLSDWENQYNQGMAQAKQQQAQDNLGALQGAADNAYNNNDYTPYDQPTDNQNPNQPPPQADNPWNPAPRPVSGGFERPRLGGARTSGRPNFSAPTSPYAPRAGVRPPQRVMPRTVGGRPGGRL